jgi:UDP-N-acetylglucosamine 2-epimerase
MKKITFIATNRVHLSRQNILINELRNYFEVDIFQPKEQNGSMSANAILYGVEFNNYLSKNKCDYVLARGDRYEVLPCVMVAAYKGIPIIHIEGGDLSGVIDNKVRHAITKLADYHFCTNEESHTRLVNMGVPLDRIWNFGSLDVEFASKVKPKRLKDKDYILVAYHPINGEDETQLDNALKLFDTVDYGIIKIGSNKDSGKEYGEETYSPEDYINLMRYATVCVGNSSSLLKEASILGVPVVLIGDRQTKRLKPKNVIDVPCETERIELAISFQLSNKYKPDHVYYKKNTSKNICSQLRKIL